MDEQAKKESLTLIYDGDCPVCSNLALRTRLIEGYTLELVDARNNPSMVAELAKKDVDIDREMVLIERDEMHVGPMAMIRLEQLAYSWGMFSVLRPLFWNRSLAVALYPLLVRLRLLLLFILGRSRISV